MTKRSSIVVTSALSLAFGGLAGCAPPPAPLPRKLDVPVDDPSQLTQIRQGIYVLNTAIWSSPDIPVCWETMTGVAATDKGVVQNAIRDSWVAESSVVTTGWGNCTASSSGVRIKLLAGPPGALCAPGAAACTRTLGSQNSGLSNNLVINVNQCAGAARIGCLQASAVHEFGHSLGFSHEQNRPDTTPANCNMAGQGDNGNQTIGSWDSLSVLNYCNAAAGTLLSPNDVEGVQMFYGAPHSITAVVAHTQIDNSEAVVHGADHFGWLYSYDGGTWTKLTSEMAGGAIGAASWSTSRFDIAYRRILTDPNTDGQIRHESWDPNPAGDILPGPGAMTYGSPQVVAPSLNQLEIFGRGSGGVPYRQFWKGGWNFDVPGQGQSALGEIGIGRMDAGNLAIFWRDTTNRLQEQLVPIGTQTTYIQPRVLWGTITSSPTAVGWTPGRVDAYALGTDGALYQWYCTASDCFGAWFLGGSLTGTPSAVSPAAGKIYIFARGTNGGLWMKSWNGSNWVPSPTTFTALDNGNTMTGSPTAIVLGSQIDIWARSPSGHLLMGTYYPDPALNYFTGFHDEGGSFR